jgi:hypothetical protein
LLSCGAVTTAPRSGVDDVVLVNANGSICGANAMCPRIRRRQIRISEIKRLRWDPPSFTPNVGGAGTVNDADPRLDGQFRADWVGGQWHIVRADR